MAVPMNYGVIKSPAKELYLKRWIIVPILQLIFAIIAAGFGAYCLYEDGSVGLIFMICAVSYESHSDYLPLGCTSETARWFQKAQLANYSSPV